MSNLFHLGFRGRRFRAFHRLAPPWALGFILLFLVSSGEAAQSLASPKAARIDELVSSYQQCGYFNGAILVAQHGDVIYAKGIGEANLESHSPNTPQTKFGIASLSKQFTAALVLQQAAKGTIRLDGALSDYLPWYRKDAGQRMTIEQLLRHTSGLPADYDNPMFCDSADAARHYEAREFAERFCQPDLVAVPGTKWAYSNSGYILLGLVLEHVTGKSFGDLLQEQILRPLNMKNTGLDRNDLAQMESSATGYVRHAGPRYTRGPYLDRGHIFSAGGMYSTVEDLFLWNQALSSGQLFSKELREQIFKPGLGDWAYGWFVTKIPRGTPGAGSTLAEMRGDMPGNFFAWILRYPDQDAVVIVLRNAYGSTERLEGNLQAILFDQQPRFPSRSPKDILAHAWWVTYGAATTHRVLSLLAMFIIVAAFFVLARRRKILVLKTV